MVLTQSEHFPRCRGGPQSMATRVVSREKYYPSGRFERGTTAIETSRVTTTPGRLLFVLSSCPMGFFVLPSFRRSITTVSKSFYVVESENSLGLNMWKIARGTTVLRVAWYTVFYFIQQPLTTTRHHIPVFFSHIRALVLDSHFYIIRRSPFLWDYFLVR